MSTSMSKEIQSQGLSSSLIQEEEIMLLQKLGIDTILGSEEMKNIASSEEFSHSKVTTTNAESKDLWSSILLPQKAIDETTNAIITPYIHPLVKKLKNTLSQKSLEICTESLGSETGSDGFSSKENKEEIEQKQLPQVEEITLQVPEYKSPTINFDSSVSLTIMSMEIFDQKPKKHKSSHHSFPPPMPTLHMLSHRDNGRLFLQAVFVPSNNNFCAKRKNGRLVLTFASEEESKVQEMEEDYDEEENEVENNEEKNDIKDVEKMGETSSVSDDLLLKNFFAEVSEVERDNEVVRILSCFKLNPFEHLKLSFDSSIDEVKKQYRKLSLMVHPDKCKHPQSKEAFGALAKAQQLLLDHNERDYLLSQVNSAKDELRAKRKKQLKKDTASKLKSMVEEGKYDKQYEQSEEFQKELKIKVRELLTEQEWRRRKMQMRISEEEGRLKKDEEEQKEMWKRKREHEEQWEGTREQRDKFGAMVRLLLCDHEITGLNPGNSLSAYGLRLCTSTLPRPHYM
ncbi:hypothetical protein TanjilG_01334 [Lupinus angustifolius]|uniref:J domain-containing protein n=1 Tax=Lupinus angustifolius TaxID=3871 RepID=A0A4P1RED5_LUPAN|nr:hypothetical protein TanjilG_01334 [Lupinus angustifolius]